MAGGVAMKRGGVATALVCASCWSATMAQAQDAPDPRPVVAVIAPYSGPHEALGARVRAMANLAWIDHQEVAVRFYDTHADGPAAAFEAAVEEGAVAILGPVGDLESDAVAVLAEDARVPLFTLAGAGVERDRRWVMRLRTTPLEQATALGAVTHTLGDIEEVAILAPDDAYGDEAVLGFIRGTRGTSTVVTRVVRYEANERDLTDALRELNGRRTWRLDVPSDPWERPARTSLDRERDRRGRPDAVFIPDYADQVSSVLPFLEFNGWLSERIDDSVRLLGLSGWAGLELTFVDGLAAGAVIVQVFHHDDITSDALGWADQASEVLGDQPLEFDAQAYDAAGFVFSTVGALPRAQRDADTLMATLAQLPTYDGVCGEMWLDGQGAVVRELRMWEVDGAGYAFPIATIHPPTP